LPKVPRFSEEFHDLAKRLLEKDPVERITWDELKKHPWWKTPVTTPSAANPNKFFDSRKKKQYSFTRRIYQPQLQFDKYLLQVRGIDPRAYHHIK
jgi:serine/threonine protein kinase